VLVSINTLYVGALDHFCHGGLTGSLVGPIFVDSALARSYNRRVGKSSTYDYHPENQCSVTVNV